MSQGTDEGLSKEKPKRKETFLARYPRKLKLGITFVILAGILTPLFFSESDLAERHSTPKVEIIAKHVDDNAAKPTEAPDSSQSAKTNTIPARETQTAEQSGQAADKTTVDAAKENDADDHGTNMSKAPELGLAEITPEGDLPRIGENGHQPWQVYARPFNNADKRPRIAIVIVGLGLSNMSTMDTVDRMHSSITLVFDAQSPIVGSWLARARQMGHETLISVPMEPMDYPRSDPGPKTMLTNLPDADNIDRLHHALCAGSGYVGVTTMNGTRFITNMSKLTPVLTDIKSRGLMVLDSHISQHSLLEDAAKQLSLPLAKISHRIDDAPTPDAIDTALAQLEQIANTEGQAVGLAYPLPVTLDRLEIWIKQLPERGIALAPLSATVR